MNMSIIADRDWLCLYVIVKDDEEVKSVTQQFCEWVASLGGDSNNIDEATITSLFASGYETKPALSVPVHVVELANVPPELRLSAALPPTPPSKSATTRPVKLGCARVGLWSVTISRNTRQCLQPEACDYIKQYFRGRFRLPSSIRRRVGGA